MFDTEFPKDITSQTCLDSKKKFKNECIYWTCVREKQMGLMKHRIGIVVVEQEFNLMSSSKGVSKQ